MASDPFTPNSPDPIDEIRRRAALLAWTTGGAESLLSGTCMAVSLALHLTSPDQLAAGGANPDQVALVRDTAPAIAGAALVLGLLPGLACVLLGFGVRRGRRALTTGLLVLLVTQAIVVGLILLNGLLTAVLRGDPIAFSMTAVIFGSMLGLLAASIIWTGRARAFAGESGGDA